MINSSNEGVIHAMPLKVDKLAIRDANYDRRVKLTEEQRKEIKELYQTGNYSMTALGKLYNVTRHTIANVVNEARYQKRLESNRERFRGGTYYNKEQHRKSVANYRNYKKKLLAQGIIQETKED